MENSLVNTLEFNSYLTSLTLTFQFGHFIDRKAKT